MTDLTHLDALRSRLAREQQRLANARTENEKAFRIREITACEKEIAGEYKFLGIEPLPLDDILSDDALLAALTEIPDLAMTYTICSNGGKFEWIIYKGENIVRRSGLIFNTYAAAKRAMLQLP